MAGVRLFRFEGVVDDRALTDALRRPPGRRIVVSVRLLEPGRRDRLLRIA